METVYKVNICKNTGEKSFYIKLISKGEFSEGEFQRNEFNYEESSRISPGLFAMLKDGSCVTQLQRLIDPTEEILNSITEDHNIDITDIKTYNSCSECNRLGYGIEIENGQIIYPNNTDELKDYNGKIIHFEYDGVVYYGKVIEYKYHFIDRSDKDAIIIDGCYNSYEEAKYTEDVEETYDTGRCVYPDVLTKKNYSC